MAILFAHTTNGRTSETLESASLGHRVRASNRGRAVRQRLDCTAPEHGGTSRGSCRRYRPRNLRSAAHQIREYPRRHVLHTQCASGNRVVGVVDRARGISSSADVFCGGLEQHAAARSIYRHTHYSADLWCTRRLLRYVRHRTNPMATKRAQYRRGYCDGLAAAQRRGPLTAAAPSVDILSHPECDIAARPLVCCLAASRRSQFYHCRTDPAHSTTLRRGRDV